jgi:hypothetical protein
MSNFDRTQCTTEPPTGTSESVTLAFCEPFFHVCYVVLTILWYMWSSEVMWAVYTELTVLFPPASTINQLAQIFDFSAYALRLPHSFNSLEHSLLPLNSSLQTPPPSPDVPSSSSFPVLFTGTSTLWNVVCVWMWYVNACLFVYDMTICSIFPVFHYIWIWAVRCRKPQDQTVRVPITMRATSRTDDTHQPTHSY